MARQHDSIMVVVEKLTKFAHLIIVKLAHKEATIEDIYLKELIRLHGIPKEIILYKDPKFSSNFWKILLKGFGINMNFSIAYHFQIDGQIERVNQVIENMLRMYVMDKQSKWEDYLHLIEFLYNSGYQTSLEKSPFD